MVVSLQNHRFPKSIKPGGIVEGANGNSARGNLELWCAKSSNIMARLSARLMARKVSAIIRDSPWRSDFVSWSVAVEGQSTTQKKSINEPTYGVKA